MALPATRTAAALDKSSSQMVTKAEPFTDRFWAAKLGADQKTVQWQVDDESGEEEAHRLHIKMAVLGENCVDKQVNIVMLKTLGADEAEVEGAIVQLGKGHGALMSPCDVTVDGRDGCTITLVSGDGPVYLSGVHRHEHGLTDELERTQWATDDETAEEPSDDEDLDEEEEEEDFEEEDEEPAAKTKKTAGKGKVVASKTAKGKKKKADTEEEDEEDEDEEEEEEEDMEEEEEEEEEKPAKKIAKKANGTTKDKKGPKTTPKAKTPETKKGKKAAKGK